MTPGTPQARPSPPRLQRVAVVGTGLIGTSVGMALYGRGVDVVLYDASPVHVQRAADLGAGRVAATTWPGSGAVPEGDVADVAVLATPPETLGAVLAEAQGRGVARTYTDVASVKVRPLRDARAAGADLTCYVGGHPLAGRERSGPGAARADLFAGRPWVLTPCQAGADHAERVRALVLACGALPVLLDPVAHDEAVALVSHAPQVVASLVAARLREAPADEVELAGQGVRDVTRIAASDPGLWVGILAANAAPVRRVLSDLRDDLDRVIAALSVLGEASAGAADPAPDPDPGRQAAALEAVAATLQAGVAGRARIPGKHGAAPTTYASVPVVVPDAPGELGRLLVAAGRAGVNVEDVAIEHSPGRPVGLVELAVRPELADTLTAALRADGWTVHR